MHTCIFLWNIKRVYNMYKKDKGISKWMRIKKNEKST